MPGADRPDRSRPHDAPCQARDPDPAALLERAHLSDDVCSDPLTRRSVELPERGHGRRARELVFTEMSATDEDGRVVAHAVQTYRIG